MEAGVLSLLLKLDTKKGSGPDKIPNMVLKRRAVHWSPEEMSFLSKTSISSISACLKSRALPSPGA
ncbi:hypothetical protein HPB52_006822 [Rhipicephalus sanguineus]|uniref:Uncharacterized protein n=1 Tax=Rhipicephalus sanguineus TaxID=34632 RepID=A0A9D4QDS5_RHISA|nr:hypothetical protein HPB52_006822 [Rhipicephalus sanguineus]